ATIANRPGQLPGRSTPHGDAPPVVADFAEFGRRARGSYGLRRPPVRFRQVRLVIVTGHHAASTGERVATPAHTLEIHAPATHVAIGGQQLRMRLLLAQANDLDLNDWVHRAGNQLVAKHAEKSLLPEVECDILAPDGETKAGHPH